MAVKKTSGVKDYVPRSKDSPYNTRTIRKAINESSLKLANRDRSGGRGTKKLIEISAQRRRLKEAFDEYDKKQEK